EVNSELAMFTEACQAAYEASEPKLQRTSVEKDRCGALDRIVMACFSEHPQYDVSTFRELWVRRNKIHADVAGIQKEPLHKQSNKVNNKGTNNVNHGAKGITNSYAHVVKGNQIQNVGMEECPNMVLDETCLNHEDFSLCLLGKVKEFASLTNLKVVLGKEGYANIELKYMGGFWVMIVFQDDQTKKRFQFNFAVGSWFSQVIQAHNDFVIDERVIWVEVEGILCMTCWVCAIEVPGWVPNFEEDGKEGYDVNDGSHEDDMYGGVSENLKDVEGLDLDRPYSFVIVYYASQRSKEDDVQKISTSVFVINFPDGYGAKDL
nr:nucleotide-binding alpha-beta plait domain-containing protein [Tanacetum cinerariifolium]